MLIRASEALGGEQAARSWLAAPALAFHGECPLDFLRIPRSGRVKSKRCSAGLNKGFSPDMALWFRIVQERWAANAMDGEGARFHGGRWNPPGLAAVYLAESRALAALEVVVHVPREFLLLDWRVIAVEVPDDAIKVAAVKRLPEAWRDQPSSPLARRFGGAWLSKG